MIKIINLEPAELSFANRLAMFNGELCNALFGTKQTFIRIQELIKQLDSELQVDGGNSHV